MFWGGARKTEEARGEVVRELGALAKQLVPLQDACACVCVHACECLPNVCVKGMYLRGMYLRGMLFKGGMWVCVYRCVQRCVCKGVCVYVCLCTLTLLVAGLVWLKPQTPRLRA